MTKRTAIQKRTDAMIVKSILTSYSAGMYRTTIGIAVCFKFAYQVTLSENQPDHYLSSSFPRRLIDMS